MDVCCTFVYGFLFIKALCNVELICISKHLKNEEEGEYALLKTFSDIMVENRCIRGKSKTSCSLHLWVFDRCLWPCKPSSRFRPDWDYNRFKAFLFRNILKYIKLAGKECQGTVILNNYFAMHQIIVNCGCNW